MGVQWVPQCHPCGQLVHEISDKKGSVAETGLAQNGALLLDYKVHKIKLEETRTSADRQNTRLGNEGDHHKEHRRDADINTQKGK